MSKEDEFIDNINILKNKKSEIFNNHVNKYKKCLDDIIAIIIKIKRAAQIMNILDDSVDNMIKSSIGKVEYFKDKEDDDFNIYNNILDDIGIIMRERLNSYSNVCDFYNKSIIILSSLLTLSTYNFKIYNLLNIYKEDDILELIDDKIVLKSKEMLDDIDKDIVLYNRNIIRVDSDIIDENIIKCGVYKVIESIVSDINIDDVMMNCYCMRNRSVEGFEKPDSLPECSDEMYFVCVMSEAIYILEEMRDDFVNNNKYDIIEDKDIMVINIEDEKWLNKLIKRNIDYNCNSIYIDVSGICYDKEVYEDVCCLKDLLMVDGNSINERIRLAILIIFIPLIYYIYKPNIYTKHYNITNFIVASVINMLCECEYDSNIDIINSLKSNNDEFDEYKEYVNIVGSYGVDYLKLGWICEYIDRYCEDRYDEINIIIRDIYKCIEIGIINIEVDDVSERLFEYIKMFYGLIDYNKFK